MIFDEAIEIVFEEEGPLSYDTKDGLPTKWGLRAAYFPAVYRETFSKDDARPLYKAQYWDKVSCDKFPAFLRFVLFECSINQGQITAIKALQHALRVKEDGWIGPVTIQSATDSGMKGLAEFAARRAQLYAADTGYIENGHGWLARLERDVIRSAKYLVTG